MTSQPSDGSSLFTRVVREPLDVVVPPLVRDALIHDALRGAKMPVPPQDRTLLQGFVNAQLREVLARALGAELGNSVVEEMLHALDTAPPDAVSPSRPAPRIPRPRGNGPTSSSAPPPASGQPTSDRAAPSDRASAVPSSGRASAIPPSDRASAIPPSTRPSVTPDSTPRSGPAPSAPAGAASSRPGPRLTSSLPPSRRGSSLPPQTDLPALATSSARRGSTAPPQFSLPATLPPAGRSVPPAGPLRTRPSPVPYGMRRPTPPTGMVDARSLHGDSTRFSTDAPPPISVDRPLVRTSRPPVPSTAVPRAPLVLVGTQDRAVYEALARCFEERARVRRFLSAADIVRELDEAGPCRKIIILDVQAPTVRPTALAVLLEAIQDVEVVLCRSEPAAEAAVAAVSPAAAQWVVHRDAASVEGVAEACAVLVS